MELIFNLLKLLLLIIAITYTVLLFQSFYKSIVQKKLYKEAKEYSIEKNKPLLVIGDPMESSTNYLFGSYGCGDICIDANGCKCDTNAIIIKNTLEDELPNFKDNSVVIFESETLEYVDNRYINDVIENMYRISNKDIFSVHQLKPNSFLTTLKQKGYKFFNYLINKPIYEYQQLFNSYPPYGDFKYTKV